MNNSLSATLHIKPLSVNKAWQGQRFKTAEYKKYENDMQFLLPKKVISNDVQLAINIVFGMSNKASDIDNPLKPFLDVLQKKYGFDDRNIYQLTVKKDITKKNKEFIAFNIQVINGNN